ncbi:MAG: multi-sensor signal transduction histidine kinase [Acidobacteriales bacterium]|nr:multi-sensor signal transduction histidine kinase [Terriglobales bacterium]
MIKRPKARSSEPISKARLFSFQNRILLSALLISTPGFGFAQYLLWTSDFTLQNKWTICILLAVAWALGALFLQSQVMRPLQTMANMVAALREDDFSFRARGASRHDALGELVLELNLLSDNLQSHRLGALEAVALLKKVLMEIDVAVFTFDPKQRLRIVNRAGEQLMALTAENMLGKTAEELSLHELLKSGGPQTVRMTFPGKEGRWAIQHTKFREAGVPHELLLISDLSRALREEERQAWQRLIRVLGHELNNSLAPIKSIAGTLITYGSRNPLPADWQQDVQRGLGVIEGRADSLSRFMQAYTKLAKLPAPSITKVDVSSLVHRAASLETRLPVQVEDGEPVTIEADPDQLEQLLINIIRNAVDATLDPTIKTPGNVRVSWNVNGRGLQVYVRDEGPGLLNSKNLFVPFFTTKTNGSGIGLVLSRQIAEAHGGSFTLKNRVDHTGCEAELRLPIAGK